VSERRDKFPDFGRQLARTAVGLATQDEHATRSSGRGGTHDVTLTIAANCLESNFVGVDGVESPTQLPIRVRRQDAQHFAVGGPVSRRPADLVVHYGWCGHAGMLRVSEQSSGESGFESGHYVKVPESQPRTNGLDQQRRLSAGHALLRTVDCRTAVEAMWPRIAYALT